MKEIKQKPAGGKPKTADAARVPKAVVKAAWLQAREAARAGEKQVVGGKDGAYSGAADTGEKGADKLVSTGERVTELAYRGGRKLAERSAGQRRERAKAAQTGGEAAQRHGAGETIAHGSTMHVEGVLANNDYILNGCYIEITSNCNLRCIHCYNESGELRDQISVEAFKNVLGCYDNPKKASITLSGGEPLLHPQVWKFIDMMLESGILARNILLITNATCITDDVANMLAEKHVSVQVSLNGSRAELHDSICGKGNFERTMAGLQRLLSKHANMVIVRNMMNKQNMNDNWDMFCEKLIDMGVHKIMLAGLKKVGRANENLEKIALTPLEYQSLIDRLKESKVITGINDEYRKLAGDEAESNIRIDIPVPYSGVCPYVYQDENPVPISPRIATNGDVYLCQSFMDQRYCLGNINKDSLPHALFNENFINLVNFMTTGRFYMDDCNKCVLKYQCPRGCIGDCLANGSIHETDGGCFFRKENAIRQLLKQSEAIAAEHMQF